MQAGRSWPGFEGLRAKRPRSKSSKAFFEPLVISESGPQNRGTESNKRIEMKRHKMNSASRQEPSGLVRGNSGSQRGGALQSLWELWFWFRSGGRSWSEARGGLILLPIRQEIFHES
jgi:hypothetical protein